MSVIRVVNVSSESYVLNDIPTQVVVPALSSRIVTTGLNTPEKIQDSKQIKALFVSGKAQIIVDNVNIIGYPILGPQPPIEFIVPDPDVKPPDPEIIYKTIVDGDAIVSNLSGQHVTISDIPESVLIPAMDSRRITVGRNTLEIVQKSQILQALFVRGLVTITVGEISVVGYPIIGQQPPPNYVPPNTDFFPYPTHQPFSPPTGGGPIIVVEPAPTGSPAGLRSFRIITTLPDSVKVTDYCVVVQLSVPLPIFLNLPPVKRGAEFVIKDGSGNSDSFPITLVPSGASKIDGAPNYVILSPYGSIHLIGGPINWIVT